MKQGVFQMLYILDDHDQPVLLDVTVEAASSWSHWRRDNFARCRVGCDHVEGLFSVATTFTGMSVEDPPCLWETVIFTRPGAEIPAFEDVTVFGRYETRGAAEAGHLSAVQLCKQVHAGIAAQRKEDSHGN